MADDEAPRRPRRAITEDPLGTRWQAMAVYGLIALLLLLAVQKWTTRDIQTLTWTEFRDALAKGMVDEARVAGDSIHGTYTPEKGKEGAQKRRFQVPRVALETPDLEKELRERGVNVIPEQESFLFEIFLWSAPFVAVTLVWVFIMRRMGDAQRQVLSFGRNKPKLYAETDTRVTFQDVAGVDEAVEEVREIVDFLKNPTKFERLGARIPKGVLLVGLPGTGKTLLARAVAGEAKVPFFNMVGSEFVEMFVGVGASRVRDLFKQALEKAPCIVFIDEIDALGKARGVGMMAAHDEREQTLNQLLAEMDGFQQTRGLILMAATNRPEILDPALLRPGRFDRSIVVDRPDLDGREAILKVHAKNVKTATDVDLRVIAQRTVGMVGADLANVINEAALLAGRKGKEQVETSDFEEAIDRVIAGLEKKTRVLNEKEREIVAYHESGHALCAELCEHADRVHKVSIVPRGVAALGFTMQLPAEDRYLMTEPELYDRLTVMLGGRAAEEVVFGQVTTGAANDLEHATQFARRMVTEFGMSDKVGLPSLEGRGRAQFLRLTGLGGEREYSEETAREIDLEVKRILEEAFGRARSLITDRRDALDRVARRLKEREVIDHEELVLLVKGDARQAAPAAPEKQKEG